MAQVSLYGLENSPYPARVAILLEELKIKYNYVKKESGEGPNGIKSPDYLAINPFGKVPTLVDHAHGDHVIWDSTAIVLYLAETWKASSIIGKTPEERADILKWAMSHATDCSPLQSEYVYVYHTYRARHPGKDIDLSVYERYVNQIHVWCGMLEKQLEKGDFIVLDRFTLADVVIFPMLNLLQGGPFNFNVDIQKYSKLRSYLDRIQYLPAVRQAYKHFPVQPRKE